MNRRRIRDNTRRNIAAVIEPDLYLVRPIERSKQIPFQAIQTSLTAAYRHLYLLNLRTITLHLGL